MLLSFFQQKPTPVLETETAARQQFLDDAAKIYAHIKDETCADIFANMRAHANSRGRRLENNDATLFTICVFFAWACDTVPGLSTPTYALDVIRQASFRRLEKNIIAMAKRTKSPYLKYVKKDIFGQRDVLTDDFPAFAATILLLKSYQRTL